MNLPVAFEAAMRVQLGDDFGAFEAALQATTPVSVRLNAYKMTTRQCWPEAEGVLWHRSAFYLSERPVFALDPVWHSGGYYVQEASSMLLAEVVRQSLAVGSKSLKVLDMCAAPGGKSTLLADVLPEGSLVVANEVIRHRTEILAENVVKWGNPNMVVTNADPAAFAPLAGWFDAVLVDAPCSGEGLFRKDPAAMREWSPEAVQTCAARQRRILAESVLLLREGGLLWYSTCTYNASENDQNVAWLCAEMGMELVAISMPELWGITPTEGGWQCYPHRTRGEGFFIACLRKVADTPCAPPDGYLRWERVATAKKASFLDWIAQPETFRYYYKPDGTVVALPVSWLEEFGILQRVLRPRIMGFEVGEPKGNDLAPAHALALSTARSEAILSAELSKNEALTFLKKESLGLDLQRGWTLMQYNGLPIGWAKAIPGRINNYLPKHFRLRMDLGKK